MKKLYLAIIAAGLILSVNNYAYSITPAGDKSANITVDVNKTNLSDKEEEVIKKFSLKSKFQRSPEAQIQSFFKKLNKYSEKNNIEELKKMYSDKFVNSDGFNKKEIFEMMELASGAYKNINYTTTLDKIEVDGNYALVYAHEVAQGETVVKQKQVDDWGLVVSDIYYKDYLHKEGNDWKIITSEIESEKLSLKYGEAKKMDITISAPQCVPAGYDYDVEVKTTSPDGVFMVGSIVNEQIVHPQLTKKDVYRSVKSGVLQRVLTANTNNRNEYATITLGVTRPIVDPPDVTFNMTGMAFVMSRVNVVSKNNSNNKEVKEIVNAKK